MDRRGLLALLAGSVVAGLTACSSEGTKAAPKGSTSAKNGSGETKKTSTDGRKKMFGPPKGIVKAPLPRGTLYALPGKGDNIALTVDDGIDEAVVAGYARLARDTGMRLTFFCNGINPSWTMHKDLLRPLIDSGQCIIANHTWSHPSLVGLSSAGVVDQVQRNETFLRNTYGVTGRPFLRPPFGYFNDVLDNQLADLGYPAVTMWLGSLSDATVISPARIMFHARQWFLPQHLVIGHANHPAVMHDYGKLVDLIKERHLQPVHLGDVFQLT
ncbi:polysaccharide deacetylase family protein [Flexivirga caeni]|uniref:Polysaccharide deacetylase family protein n=1 Tax=Flexivirga caeni TaxID=2294115 RepID=A0A3M9LYM8_9MICO|nr:polysaccharide deacetylase family protein [Flexivirga caeni]RNI18391.1 polysaccharide deacetylase family protein [Flexivirga caeni]